jgi:hypothetical protein
MATPAYRSPTSLPIEAALIPARLAEHYDHVVWRELPGGEIEIATKEGNRVERIRVHRDGTTTPVGSSTHRTWLRRTLFFGPLALGAATVLARVDSEDKWFLTFFVLLFAIGFANDLAEDMGSHLRRELRTKDKWHRPTKLHDWTPRTTAQLTAVENIATEHGGTAYVSDNGGPTIEVVSGLHLYLLDAKGDVVEHQQNRALNMKRDKARRWVDITTWVADGG